MIQISNTDYNLLESCKQKIGAGGVFLATRKPNRKPAFAFHMQGILDAQALLKQIKEALILKRERAEIVLQFIHEILNGKTDTLLYERIYLLNNRSSSNH